MLKKETLRKACFRAIDNILYEGTTDVELFIGLLKLTI